MGWLIAFGCWVAAGIPVGLFLGYLYGKQWDGRWHGVAFLLCVVVSFPFMAVCWAWMRIRYGRARP